MGPLCPYITCIFASVLCAMMHGYLLVPQAVKGVWRFLRRRRGDLGKGFKQHRKVVSKWLVARLRLKSALLTSTGCPSGLRGWTQVPLVKTVWVQIPQLSLVVFLLPANHASGLLQGMPQRTVSKLVSKLVKLASTARCLPRGLPETSFKASLMDLLRPSCGLKFFPASARKLLCAPAMTP